MMTMTMIFMVTRCKGYIDSIIVNNVVSLNIILRAN